VIKMHINDCVQGSDEWKAARCGSLGGSRFHEAIAKTKSGWGASRSNLAAELVIERLTGQPVEKFVNDAMRAGTENEPIARGLYEFMNDCEVQQVGLILHPHINKSHSSPDGLVADDGLIEIKAPLAATHLKTLLGEDIDHKYRVQMMWGMAVSGRQWCDFVSFNPSFPSEMQLYVQRVHRDDAMIAELEKEARIFLSEVDQTISKLTTKYRQPIAAE